jgi:transcriptional regulator with PAS, ATPase and Fis domain
VSDGLFREDLFYRLNVVGIVLPPLRERRDDIPHLANHFVEKYSEQYNRSFKKLSDKVHGKILDHAWPGNVRQLENVIKRMIVLDSDKIDIPASDLSIETSQRSPAALSVSVVEVNSILPVAQIAQNKDNLKDVVRQLTYQAEEEAIRRVLLENRWNRKNSARVLGVSYKTLLQKMKQYNLSGQKG